MNADKDPVQREAVIAAILLMRVQASSSWINRARLRVWGIGQRRRELLDRVDRTWELLGRSGDAPEMRVWREQALAQSQNRPTDIPRLVTPRTLKYALAASVLALVGGGALILPSANSVQEYTYTTRPAEQRNLVLTDGTKISLDVASHIQVSMTARVRNVRLIEGRARFDIARDVARPFHVLIDNLDVTDLGTDFIASKNDGRLDVSLVDGLVLISTAKHDERTIFGGKSGKAVPVAHLRPGQAFEKRPGEAPRIVKFDRVAMTGWQRGLILLDDAALGNAAAILGRYGVDVTVAPEIAHLRISGVVTRASGLDWAGGIAAIHPEVEATRVGDRAILSRRSTQ